MSGAELIAVERKRQIEAEGWTAEHDNEHSGGCLARAGAVYAAYTGAKLFRQQLPGHESADVMAAEEYLSKSYSWPWDAEWWKPSPDSVRNLVKAGALIAAEIDRLQRKETP